MICRYFITIKCLCPVDGCPDTYDAVIESAEMISVETIIEAAREAGLKRQFQEELTADLARRLGWNVTTRGFHSGVLTVVLAP